MIDLDAREVSRPAVVLPRTGVLSVITGQSVRLEGIGTVSRARRVFTVDLIDTVASASVAESANALEVHPGNGPSPGEYEFDLTRFDHEAGLTVPEVWAPVLTLLSRADGPSIVRLRGVTHGPSRPGYARIGSVLPAMLTPLGYEYRATLQQWGFPPEGEGVVGATIDGGGSTFEPSGVTLLERGEFRTVEGVSVVGNLPADVLRRQTRQTRDGLVDAGFDPSLESVPVESHQPGTAVELTAHYEQVAVSFLGVGEPDKRAESVAREAVSSFRDFHRREPPVPGPLGADLLFALLLAGERSVFRTVAVTPSLEGTVTLANCFPGLRVSLEGDVGDPGRVEVESTG